MVRVYEFKLADVSIVADTVSPAALFDQSSVVVTDGQKADRLWTGLGRYLTAGGRLKLVKTFLAELPGAEDQLLHYIRYAIARPGAEHDFSHPAVLFVENTARKVHREKHRMEAFVRFKKSADGLFTAVVEPDFNVLPLIASHFEKRYADQRWLIYDRRRKYGLHYDLRTTSMIELLPDAGPGAALMLDEGEEAYADLWKNYFDSVNIQARRNLKLHVRHMPKRYWKLLTEKQPRRL